MGIGASQPSRVTSLFFSRNSMQERESLKKCLDLVRELVVFFFHDHDILAGNVPSFALARILSTHHFHVFRDNFRHERRYKKEKNSH